MKLNDFIRANKAANRFFRENLKNSKMAKEYIFSRLSKRTIRRYGIGYAPSSGLKGYLIDNGFGIKYAKMLNLLIEYDGNTFDFFRQRITIPIVNAGMIIGFGGRDIRGRAQSKYLNSKNSIVYDKNSTLYGLYQHAKFIDKLGYGILVEGYMDVLGCADHGILNTFGTCGTSVTKTQAEIIKIYTDFVYIVYDGDEPGQDAAKRAKRVFSRSGITSKIVNLKNNMDPDDYLKKHGKRKFIKVIRRK